LKSADIVARAAAESASSYARLAAVVFAIVAIVQLARAAAGWPVTIAVEVLVWASWVACVIAGVFAG
jgi:hypothetical protein